MERKLQQAKEEHQVLLDKMKEDENKKIDELLRRLKKFSTAQAEESKAKEYESMIKQMEDEARRTKEQAEKMKELEQAGEKIIAKMKANELLEREKLMAQLKEEMNKKNLGGISEQEVDKSTQKLGLAVNALKDKPDDTRLESNTLEAIEELKAMRRLYDIEQNRVLKLNQEREEKEKLLREQEAMMQKEKKKNEDLLRQQEAAAQKRRKDEEEQLHQQELALQKEMELLEKQKLENMKCIVN